jgi:pilus assembly protein FimV
MTVYNKLKLAILAVLSSQPLYAITIDPIQIQSAPGELLYAEMNFRNAEAQENIQASLASAEELMSLGVQHQPPGHLNFYTRKNARGEGVITITSSRPLTEKELNLVIKVQVGDTARLQHIRTSLISKNKEPNTLHSPLRLSGNEQALSPMMIVSEKEIGLNLPISHQYLQPPVDTTATRLNILKATPPSIANTPSLSMPMTVQNTPVPAPDSSNEGISAASTMSAAENKNEAPAMRSEGHQVTSTLVAAKSSDPLVQKYAESMAAQAKQPVEKAQPSVTKAQPLAEKPASSSYVVRSNESLWKIAERVAAQQNRPVNDVMQQIKRENAHAFIQGDANRLKNGSTLNLPGEKTAREQQKRQIAELAKKPSTQSGKAKYRLNQAEMSLIAENGQDSAHGSAKKGTQSAKTSNELSLKVKTSREKTVKLQRNVTQLELALNKKDHRIQLLNARLAQLQQQLQAQQVEKKSKH